MPPPLLFVLVPYDSETKNSSTTDQTQKTTLHVPTPTDSPKDAMPQNKARKYTGATANQATAWNQYNDNPMKYWISLLHDYPPPSWANLDAIMTYLAKTSPAEKPSDTEHYKYIKHQLEDIADLMIEREWNDGATSNQPRSSHTSSSQPSFGQLGLLVIKH